MQRRRQRRAAVEAAVVSFRRPDEDDAFANAALPALAGLTLSLMLLAHFFAPAALEAIAAALLW